MLVTNFSDRVASGKVTCENGVFIVKGRLHLGYRQGSTVHYRAAEPTDLRLSIEGSGLPFPNEHMAFGPVNSGVAATDKYGNFKFQVFSPNSYYLNDDIMHGIGHGKILMAPSIEVSVILPNGQKKQYNLNLTGYVPLRSLTNMPGKHVRSTGRNTPSFLV